MNYIVIDLEYNQAFDFTKGQKAMSNPRCPVEVIQIGAVKLNENFEIVGTFNAYVRPRVYRRLHPYVAKITGIRNQDLNRAPSFPNAYANFLKFTEADDIICMWGPDDIKELYRNIFYHSQPTKNLTKKYINVQNLAGKYLKRNNCTGLKTAVEELGIPIEAEFHNALNDAMYTARILQVVKTEDMVPLSIDLKRVRNTIAMKSSPTNIKMLFNYVEGKLKRKLTDKDRDVFLTVYNAGRDKQFDKDTLKSQNAKIEDGELK